MIKRMSVDHSRNGLIREAFLDMIIDMGLPLSMGSHPSFVKFYKSIDNDLYLPGRKSTTKLIVEDKFQRMYNTMLGILERARVVHATCDMWSSFKVSFSGKLFSQHQFCIDQYGYRSEAASWAAQLIFMTQKSRLSETSALLSGLSITVTLARIL